MPLYDYRCSNCGFETELILYGNRDVFCDKCGFLMDRLMPSNVMIKIRGEGGYPSRRKQIRNTTYRNHPPLEHDPKRAYF